MKTMKIQVLFVLVLILKSCVCFKLNETFARQTIEDGPYGGEFNIVFNVFQFIMKGVEEVHGLMEVRSI